MDENKLQTIVTNQKQLIQGFSFTEQEMRKLKIDMSLTHIRIFNC
jgi:hypothetical protein